MYDQFARCEESCTHELAQGGKLEELLSGDGPDKAYADKWLVKKHLERPTNARSWIGLISPHMT